MTRSYSASAYFAPNQARPNLLVLTGAQVTLVDSTKVGAEYKATGVRFSAGGQSFTAAANKEVILSAGKFYIDFIGRNLLMLVQVPSRRLRSSNYLELETQRSLASSASRPRLIFRVSERTCR